MIYHLLLSVFAVESPVQEVEQISETMQKQAQELSQMPPNTQDYNAKKQGIKALAQKIKNLLSGKKYPIGSTPPLIF